MPTVIEADGVIKVYYEINEYNYQIQYFYEGDNYEAEFNYVQDTTKTVNGTKNYNEEVATYEDKVIPGYEFEKIEVLNSKTGDNKLPLVITTDSTVPSKNIIKVFYKKLNINYTVEYYYEKTTAGSYEKDNSLTETITIAKFGDEISTYTAKPKTGFEFEKADTLNSKTGDGKLPLVISANAANNVIRVYYNRESYAYTIEYYYNGEKEETITDLTAKFGTEISEYPDKNRPDEGFKFEKAETTNSATEDGQLPLVISENAENNVIKVYYGTPNVKVKSIGVDEAYVGEVIRYVITLENTGRVAGTIDVKNELPELVTYVSSNVEPDSIEDGVLTWKDITVEPGVDGEVTITIDVKVNDNAIGETLVDTVIVPGQADEVHETKVHEVSSTLQEIKQGESGKDSVNIILVMDLSTSMNDPIKKFVECTHEHETYFSYLDWQYHERCPQGCTVQFNGKWGKLVNVSPAQTRIQAAKAAAQGFINNIYSDPNSKATVTVVTFNKKSGNSKYVGTKVLTFNNGTKTATKDNYAGLVTEIGNITIGTNMGTHIKAALDTTYDTIYGTNGLKTIYPNNSNVIIFLGDGEPTPTTNSGYSDNSTTNISNQATAIKNKGATIYSIGFGEEATDPNGDGYAVLKDISSNNTVYTANDYSELSQIFTNIQAELADKIEGTHIGTLTFTASNTLVVDSSNPLKAKIVNGEQETVLFTCTSMDELDDYNITYDSSTKVLTWDLNAYNTGSAHTHVTSNNAVLSYYVAR